MISESRGGYKSAQEMAQKLGLTLQEAKVIWKSWGYEPPSDPEELLDHSRRWSQYDRDMADLNQWLRRGEITEAEYHEREAILYQKYSS